MALSSRFSLDTLAVVGAGLLAVSAMSFSASTAGWIGFGVSTVFTLAAAVAALAFSGSALTWLVFADALALAAVALADLTAHEVGTEHVVHSLEVRPVTEHELAV